MKTTDIENIADMIPDNRISITVRKFDKNTVECVGLPFLQCEDNEVPKAVKIFHGFLKIKDKQGKWIE